MYMKDAQGQPFPVKDWVRHLPKVLLHDHLDGGVRPSTLLALASDQSHRLPAETPEALADWFLVRATSGDLEAYLSTFDVVNSLLQGPDALRRVAEEAVEDLAADGVMYAELRFAPERHVEQGMSEAASVAAVADGIRRAVQREAGRGREIEVRLILCAVRNFDRSKSIADLVVDDPTGLVCAFDLAGGEAGAPPSRHAEALAHVQTSGGNVTIHAGEIPDLRSVEEAVSLGAQRLGHGVALADALDVPGQHGDLAAHVRAAGLILETCPISNVQTGFCEDLSVHPAGRLLRAGFRVTINTDNRLMSDTSPSHELASIAKALDWGPDELVVVTRYAIDGAFIAPTTRAALHARLDRWMEKQE